MERRLLNCPAAARPDVGDVLFPGPALRSGREHYLVPVDGPVSRRGRPGPLIRVDDVIAECTRPRTYAFPCLDACRDTPLAAQLKRSIGTRPQHQHRTRFLQKSIPIGMIIAMRRSPGARRHGDGPQQSLYNCVLKNVETKEDMAHFSAGLAPCLSNDPSAHLP